MGEDWNGVCGGDSDVGATLFAIADGEVVFIDPVGTISGQGKQIYVRHSFPYSLAEEGLMTVDSGMLHMQNIDPVWFVGAPVDKGDSLGFLGKTGTPVAHLHWEMRGDTSVVFGENPYYREIFIPDALKYLPPSLVVDDRRSAFVMMEIPWDGQLFPFTVPQTAPSSTAYVEFGGQRKNLWDAMEAEWAFGAGIIWFDDDGEVRYEDDRENFVFVPDREYYFGGYKGAKLVIPLPGNNFLEDRARRDMIRVVSRDPRFAEVVPKKFLFTGESGAGTLNYRMKFLLNDGRRVRVKQLTYINDPLYRRVWYRDPDTDERVVVEINPNELY